MNIELKKFIDEGGVIEVTSLKQVDELMDALIEEHLLNFNEANKNIISAINNFKQNHSLYFSPKERGFVCFSKPKIMTPSAFILSAKAKNENQNFFPVLNKRDFFVEINSAIEFWDFIKMLEQLYIITTFDTSIPQGRRFYFSMKNLCIVATLGSENTNVITVEQFKEYFIDNFACQSLYSRIKTLENKIKEAINNLKCKNERRTN